MAPKPSERIEFTRPDQLPGTEILIAEHSSRVWRWYHETYTICTVKSGIGSADWKYRGKLHTGRPGEVLLYEPGEVHANQSILRDASFRVLFLAPRLVEDAATELNIRRPHWAHALTADPRIFRAFERFHASVESPSSSTLEHESRLAGCLLGLLKDCTEGGLHEPGKPTRAALFRARDFLQEHYANPVSLDMLSAVAGVSRFHLVHAFTNQFGLPPHAFQILVKISKARQLLLLGQEPSTVAAALGFADQSHFGRHFKRVTKITPRQYVRRSRAS
jgi:AraC-like DNA-binding protein